MNLTSVFELCDSQSGGSHVSVSKVRVWDTFLPWSNEMQTLSHANDGTLLGLLLMACILTFFFVGTFLIKITFKRFEAKNLMFLPRIL